MSNGHGGARPGAGRKRISEKYQPAVDAFHDRAAADLDTRYYSLAFLADGGFEEIEEVWEPAGLVFVDAPLRDATGEPKSDANGRPIMLRQQAFPELPPEQLVCVQRKKKVAGPDRKANEYLIDRVAGRPTQAIEADVELGASDSLKAAFESAVAKIYGGEA